ncbi:hypothetical protein [Actinokineospora spheciospongiae]|uniref:hypothetical protein n=1 Tax=Actinokineospora spheciospongiae TaxID=909613 RepID=UPI000D709092|nr:hypothetical protein [Actinokineospora spheciospongiae]PWW53118.1 transferase family hexapeptide repeat protein [Actinokineospora spheciospongiae]
MVKEFTAAELTATGLLHTGQGARISPRAVFLPADEEGVQRPVVVGTGAVIEAFAVIHGGATIGEGARIEAHVTVGCPELGYAVGRTHPGAGAATIVGDQVVLRSGAVVYAGVELGAGVLVGHHTLLRSAVTVGAGSLLGHHLTVERNTRIGRGVRCSPGSHITSSTRVGDHVFLGAGVRTINDKTLTWRDPDREPVLVAPRFEPGAKIGTGCIVLGGITVGAQALVGAGSLITRDVPAATIAYGHPARVHGQVTR